jgi:hypothetical protein
VLVANLADEYAQQFDLPRRGTNETGWAFRARVAYTLAAMGKPVLAHEALYNQRESSNPFGGSALSDGYGDTHVLAIAQQVEATLQVAVQQRRQQQRRQQWAHALRFWRSGR